MSVYTHYQNSSWKANPAQRDASSRNAELYERARLERYTKGKSREKEQDDGAHEYANDAATWSNSRTDDHKPREVSNVAESERNNKGGDLSSFETDTHGNVYLKKDSSSGWRKMVKNTFRWRQHRDEEKTVVR